MSNANLDSCVCGHIRGMHNLRQGYCHECQCGAFDFAAYPAKAEPIKGNLSFVRADGTTENFNVSWEDPHEAMRAGNTALRDDDARKFNASDARLVMDAAFTSRHHGSPEVADDFDKIANKIVALFSSSPPRGAGDRDD